MGVGHLNIGTGIGNAQIYQGNPGAQAYANILAQKQLKEEQDKQAMIQQMGQLKPGNLRNDADKAVYYDKYNDWRNAAIDANNTTDTRSKMEKQGLALQKYNELNGFVDDSKKQGAIENSIRNQVFNNPHLLADGAVKKFQGNTQLAVNDPNIIKDPLQYARYIDGAKADKGFNDWDSAYKGDLPWSNPVSSQGRDKQGNKTGVITWNEKQGDAADQLNAYKHIYDIDNDKKAYIDTKYSGIVDPSGDPNKTAMLRLRQNAIDRGALSVDKNGQLQSEITDKTKPEFKADYRPRVSVYNYGAANQPLQLNIPTENEHGEQVGTFSSPNYVPMNKANMNLAGVPSLNMQTQQPEQPLKSSDKYNLIGITSAPTMKNGFTSNFHDPKTGKVISKDIPAGSLAEHDYATSHPNDVQWNDYAHVQEEKKDATHGGKPYTVDHLVRADLLPNNVTGTKAWKQQTANFRSYRGSGASTTPKASTSDVSSFFK